VPCWPNAPHSLALAAGCVVVMLLVTFVVAAPIAPPILPPV
jgi:hypothetical protein